MTVRGNRWILAGGVALLLLAGCGSSSPPPSGTAGGTTSGGAGTTVGAVAAVDDGQPTGAEQEMLELIDRARRDPAGEAARFGIDLNEGPPATPITPTPKAPLALNATLLAVARAHSADMIARNYFAHNTPEGVTPFQRFTQAGYLWTAAGENLAFQGSTGSLTAEETVATMHQNLFVDSTVADRGHRVVMLTDGYRELGVGDAAGRYVDQGTTYNAVMCTCDFGVRRSPTVFVVGVIYADANHDGRYNAGEGLSGATVTLGGATKVTGAAGGYQFAVSQAGTYPLTVTASSPALSATTSVTVDNLSVKADYESSGGWILR